MTLTELQQHVAESPTGAIVFGKPGSRNQEFNYVTRGDLIRKPGSKNSTPFVVFRRIGGSYLDSTSFSQIHYRRPATAEEAALLEEIAA